MGKIDSVERREAVIKSVVNTFLEKLKKLEDSGVDIEYFKGKHYILWIETKVESTQEVFNDLIKKKKGVTLEQEIMDGLYQQGIMIDSLEIRHGAPEGNPERKEVADVVIYIVESSVTAPTPTQDNVFKARITLASGSPGGLVKTKGYLIDSKHTPYNIGRVVKPGSSNRINHIEIIDETSRVSRTHAHIDFDDKDGFFIQKDENQEGTNLTVVIRKGDDDFELRGSGIRYLKDGDIIVLRNTVRLVFHIIK